MDKKQIKIAAITSFIIAGILFLCAILFYITQQFIALAYSSIIAVCFLLLGFFVLKGDKIMKYAPKK